MSKLAVAEAEAIRRWCASKDGQCQIRALLDELDAAVMAVRSRRRRMAPGDDEIPGVESVDNQKSQG